MKWFKEPAHWDYENLNRYHNRMLWTYAILGTICAGLAGWVFSL